MHRLYKLEDVSKNAPIANTARFMGAALTVEKKGEQRLRIGQYHFQGIHQHLLRPLRAKRARPAVAAAA